MKLRRTLLLPERSQPAFGTAGANYWRSDAAMRVILLGGGIVGVTAPYQLQRDGHGVVFLERNPEAASGASWGDAGVIVRLRKPHPVWS